MNQFLMYYFFLGNINSFYYIVIIGFSEHIAWIDIHAGGWCLLIHE